MSTPTRDLWPDDISTAPFVSPVAILREQAAILAEKTKGLLEGDVTTSRVSDRFDHHFYIVAPALDNYRYKLLTVRHGNLDMYPAAIQYHPDTIVHSAQTQEQFVELLGTLLAREETKRVVHALLAQIG